MVTVSENDEETAQAMENFLQENGGEKSLVNDYITLEEKIVGLGGDELGSGEDPEAKLAELITSAPTYNTAVERFAHMTHGGMDREISVEDMGGVLKKELRVLKAKLIKELSGFEKKERFPLFNKFVSGLKYLVNKIRGRAASVDLKTPPLLSKRDFISDGLDRIQRRVAMGINEARARQAEMNAPATPSAAEPALQDPFADFETRQARRKSKAAARRSVVNQIKASQAGPSAEEIAEKAARAEQKAQEQEAKRAAEAAEVRKAAETRAKTAENQAAFDKFFPQHDRSQIQRRRSFSGSPSDREAPVPRERSATFTAGIVPEVNTSEVEKMGLEAATEKARSGAQAARDKIAKEEAREERNRARYAKAEKEEEIARASAEQEAKRAAEAALTGNIEAASALLAKIKAAKDGARKELEAKHAPDRNKRAAKKAAKIAKREEERAARMAKIKEEKAAREAKKKTWMERQKSSNSPEISTPDRG